MISPWPRWRETVIGEVLISMAPPLNITRRAFLFPRQERRSKRAIDLIATPLAAQHGSLAYESNLPYGPQQYATLPNFSRSTPRNRWIGAGFVLIIHLVSQGRLLCAMFGVRHPLNNLGSLVEELH
jgi:hypothetical protein